MSEHLAKISPASLDELFSRDPLQLSDQDIDTIVGKLREQRLDWAAKEAQGKAPKAAKPSQAVKNMTLDDLGL